MNITTSPVRLAQLFGAMMACLIVLHVIVQTVRFATGDHSLFGLLAFLSLGADGNLPTFYSAFALLFCALFLGLIGIGSLQQSRIHPGYWFGLSAVFLFLALDEMLQIHEHLSEPMRERFDTSGLLFYAWIIPYAALLLVFLAVYARFLLRLPRRTAVLFVIAGATFVAGAMGLEMLGGRHSELHGNLNLTYVFLQTLEEILEMLGVVIFIYALADYVTAQFGALRLSVSPQSARIPGPQ